eukprot:PhM_4_TR5423/c0_g1_i1/m.65335
MSRPTLPSSFEELRDTVQKNVTYEKTVDAVLNSPVAAYYITASTIGAVAVATHAATRGRPKTSTLLLLNMAGAWPGTIPARWLLRPRALSSWVGYRLPVWFAVAGHSVLLWEYHDGYERFGVGWRSLFGGLRMGGGALKSMFSSNSK